MERKAFFKKEGKATVKGSLLYL